MDKKINFLHEELKCKNTIIILLLENVVKLQDNHSNENRSIHSNSDVNITQSEKIALEHRNELKQWKQNSCQQNH